MGEASPTYRVTVADLIHALQRFPPDAITWAYEGERVGVGVRLPGPDGPQIGFVDLEEWPEGLMPDAEVAGRLKALQVSEPPVEASGPEGEEPVPGLDPAPITWDQYCRLDEDASDLELIGGYLCMRHDSRMLLLRRLLTNVGLRAAVGLAPPELFLAALADGGADTAR